MRRRRCSWWLVNEYGRREHRVVDFINRCFHATHSLRNAFWDDVRGPDPRLPTKAEAEAADITGRDSIGRRLRRPQTLTVRRPPAAARSQRR